MYTFIYNRKYSLTIQFILINFLVQDLIKAIRQFSEHTNIQFTKIIEI